MDYEKKYKEALKDMRVIYPNLRGDAKLAAEHAFPELCESEDERIRKIIRLALIASEDELSDFYKVHKIHRKECTDWLEKQKEQKPYEPKNWPVDKDNLAQEQKPLEWSEDFEDNIRNLLHDKLTWHSEDGSMSTTVFIDDKTLKDIVSGIWFYVGKEALKYPNKEIHVSEWSEEDEAAFGDLMWCIEQARKSAKDENDMGNIWFAENWLKNRLKSLRLQSRKELSIEKAIQWLDDTFYFLDNSSGRGRDCEITTHDFDSLEEMYDSFRKAVIVDSEPSWKPSEEQMNFLLAVINDPNNIGAESCYMTIKSLYNDLKKL